MWRRRRWLICRIGVKFKRYKPMTRAHLTQGITTHHLTPFSSRPIQLAILQILSTACRHVRHERELPLLCVSTCSLCASVKQWKGEGVGVANGKILPSPPPPPPPPPGATATVTTSVVAVGLVSIRNDENSADLTKSFQELSRRLPVLVNSG